MKLKEYGKYVIGVGIQESSSDLLVQNCDEYYSYTSLSGLTAAADMPTEKHDPWVLAAKAIRKMKERKDVMRSDRFKQVMLELDQSFSEKSIGFSKFNRFLTEAASRGILTLHKAANGQYEVEIGPRSSDIANGSSETAPSEAVDRPDRDSGAKNERRGRKRAPAAEKESERAGRDTRKKESSDGRQSRGRGRRSEPPGRTRDFEPPRVDEDRLRGAYELLRTVVAELAAPDRPVRDSEVKRRMVESDAGFDEAALGFRKFSRFLRQAHDEEVVDLQRGPEGNYLMAPVAGEKSRAGDRKSSAERTGRRGARGRARTGAPLKETAPPKETALPTETAPLRETALPTDTTRPTETAAEAAGSGRPGLGRFRRGSRGRGRPAAAPLPREPETAKADAPAADRSGPAQADSASEEREPPTAEREQPTADRDALVERMARGYAGVGRKTAEKLVAEFGEEVFEVIDRSPERLERILPGRRVQAIVAGRRKELEASGKVARSEKAGTSTADEA